MGKIYKLNAGGTVGVSLIKEMRENGYVPGVKIIWVKSIEGYTLRIADKPLENKVEETPQPILETI